MKRKFSLIVVVLLLLIVSITGQNKHKAFTMVNENSLVIFLSNPLSSNESFNVYRKVDAGYVLLTQTPISPILDPLEARVVLGDDWEMISKAVDSDSEVFVSRQIRANTFKGAVLSLVSNKAAQVSGRWFLDDKITKGNSYTYKLMFEKSGIISDSLILTTNGKVVIPKSPSNLKLITEDKAIRLEWEYPKWNGNFSDIGFTYNVYRKDGNGTFRKVNESIIIRDDASKPEYEDLWLKEGVKYTYKVTIVDPIGNESRPTSEVSILLEDKTPPAIVTNVVAQEGKDGISISWAMGTQLDIKGYNVYRATKLTGTFYKLTKRLVPVDTPFFKDSTITEKKQYFYTVTAVDNAGNEGKESNPISTYLKDDFPPNAPSNLSYRIINNQVQLSWMPSNSRDLAGYHVYRSRLSTGMKSRITLRTFSGTTYLDKGENDKGFGYGVKFYYVVTAQDSSNNESDSLKITVIVPDVEPPLPPVNFSLDNEGDYVYVNCGTSPSLDVDKYILSKGVLGVKAIQVAEFTKAPFSFVDTISTKGKSYFYSVSVIDTAGNVSKETAKDTIMFRDFSPPPAPRNVKARLVNGKVLLKWVETIDFDMAGYNIYRSDYPTGDYKLLNKVITTETSFTDNSGTKKYFYRIKAVDTSGNESQYDETISVK